MVSLPVFIRADFSIIECEKMLKDVSLQAAMDVLAMAPMTERLGSAECAGQLHRAAVPKIMGKWLMDMEKKKPEEVLDRLQDICTYVLRKQVDAKPLAGPWMKENLEHLLTILDYKKRRPDQIKAGHDFAVAASGRTAFARLLRVLHSCFCYCVLFSHLDHRHLH